MVHRRPQENLDANTVPTDTVLSILFLPFLFWTPCCGPLDFQGHVAPAQAAAHAEFVIVEEILTGRTECLNPVDFLPGPRVEAGGGMFGDFDHEHLGHGGPVRGLGFCR